MAAKKKPTKRPEVHITIRGPQGIGKTQLAAAIAAFIGGTTIDGDLVEDHLAVGSGTAVCRALEFLASRKPYTLESPKVIITTSNK